MLIRIQLAIPEQDFVSAEFIIQLLTMHGTTMIFFAAMPLIFAIYECSRAFANWCTRCSVSIS